jgi:hypothetical protein
MTVKRFFGVRAVMPPNSDVEADVALSRCAPSGPRSLTPVVMRTDVGGRLAQTGSIRRPRAIVPESARSGDTTRAP